MKVVFLWIVTISTIILFDQIHAARHVTFFRNDYTYEPDLDVHYKFHLYASSWEDAMAACADEEAYLYFPESSNEISAVRKLLESDFKQYPNVTDVFVGLHDKFGMGKLITVTGERPPDGIEQHLSTLDSDTVELNQCIVMSIYGAFQVDDCEQELPFICKRTDVAYENCRPCPTIDADYIYDPRENKCYKAHKTPKTWQAALLTCFNEGSLLLTINSESEAMLVTRWLEKTMYSHAGFKRVGPQENFFTLHGKRLEEGYGKFYYHKEEQMQNNCGMYHVIEGDLYVETQKCDNLLTFMCEMDIIESHY